MSAAGRATWRDYRRVYGRGWRWLTCAECGTVVGAKIRRRVGRALVADGNETARRLMRRHRRARHGVT